MARPRQPRFILSRQTIQGREFLKMYRHRTGEAVPDMLTTRSHYEAATFTKYTADNVAQDINSTEHGTRHGRWDVEPLNP